MNIKKIVAWLLAVAIIFGLCSCKKAADGSSSYESSPNYSESSSKDYITLLYSVSDSFNPYVAKTDINRQLCKLLYEPLVKLSNEFEPINSMAQSVELSDKQCKVVLKNVCFSDGSQLTASDVVYSYNLAKSSAGSYSLKLYEVIETAVVDSKTVVFSLNKADPYFANVLDFPIIKSGSDKLTDSDGVLQPPIGSGRYKVSDDKENLLLNENYYGKKGAIKTIKLINAPDSESVAHYVQIGATDIYYNESATGEILRMSGQKADININNMVYIGINQNYGELYKNKLRQAISSGINRKEICQNAFYTNALPATGFFNPVWEAVKAVQNLQIEPKSQITIENLEEIGYNSLDEKGERKNSFGNYLKLTLLVNSENRLRVAAAQMIASQLSEFGIKITVVEKSFASYIEALQNGDFQLYLGEVKLTDNMDISCMVTEGGSAAYGLYKKAETSEAVPSDTTEISSDFTEQPIEANKSAEVINGFYSGVNTIADVAVVLQTEMPFIPICYRTGAIFYNDNIENVDNSSASDIYFSIESYIINK